MEGKPVTAFLLTALTLYAVWLWRQGRLGHISGGGAMVPAPGEKAARPPIPPGWKPGPPPTTAMPQMPFAPTGMKKGEPVEPSYSGEPGWQFDLGAIFGVR